MALGNEVVVKMIEENLMTRLDIWSEGISSGCVTVARFTDLA
jgi:hypothetical protein